MNDYQYQLNLIEMKRVSLKLKWLMASSDHLLHAIFDTIIGSTHRFISEEITTFDHSQNNQDYEQICCCDYTICGIFPFFTDIFHKLEPTCLSKCLWILSKVLDVTGKSEKCRFAKASALIFILFKLRVDFDISSI